MSPSSSTICVLRASPKSFCTWLELGDDDGAELHVAREDFEIAGDEALDFGELVEDFLLLHAGEALELHSMMAWAWRSLKSKRESGWPLN
jgi:hypothetical protein